jgi:Flp pilus assembly protein TadD
LQKARECFKAQNSGGAIVWMRKAVQMEPESARYHALLARALSVVVALRMEAVQHFEKSLEIDPWNSSVRLQLAVLYEEMKLPWRARPHYVSILELEPDHAKALERMRLLDAQAGKSEGSKRSLIDRILHPSAK